MNENRRRLLALLGTTGATTLAGCGFFDDGPETVTATPLTGKAKLAPQDGDAFNSFGSSVRLSSDGTTAVIGAPNNENPGTEIERSSDGTRTGIGVELDEDPNEEGSAYVFKREGDVWREEAKLAPEDDDGNDAFGWSVGVSSDGTTAVIGAHWDENPNEGSAGSAYVFQREGGEWREETKLAPEDGHSEDRYGVVGVSGDGTTVVIGARWDENLNEYVFEREGGEWSEETKFAPEDGDEYDRFGWSVGVSSDGTTAVIGARFDEDPNRTRAGSAYVFQRESGEWREETELVPEAGDRLDFFGWSVGVSSDGTTAVIGARFDEDPNGLKAGSAYVFKRESGEWREETKLAPGDGDSLDLFGWSVGVSSDGTTAVIGTPEDEDPNRFASGSAYVFKREGGEWREETKLAPEDGEEYDKFGSSVGVSSDGTTAVIGASEDNNQNGKDAGSAYVFQLGE